MRVCVFCGSNEGRRPEYAEAARALGTELARRGISLVFGGGRVGLMGLVADATLAGGGEAIGVITRGLMDREVGHTGLTRLHVVETMHERKAIMASLADAFVVLPGGIGTMEEFFEVWTWGYLGIHAKPFGLLDVQGFYQRLSGALDHLVDEGFLKTQTRQMVITESAPSVMLDRLLAAHPTPSAPAITPEET